MNYISTRGQAPHLGFSDAAMQGPGSDGGLYLPESYPQFSAAELRAMRNLPYAELAAALMRPFTGDCPNDAELRAISAAAYASFHHPAVCPLAQTDSREFALELFYGPSLAYKDFAMQFLAKLMDFLLKKRERKAAIIGATSGDTGGAAIEAFAGCPRADVFMLFPQSGISAFQQWQMTCNAAGNTHAIAIDGSFDDCRSLVKMLFSDADFRAGHRLAAIDSINWARVMAQIVYYFSAALTLGAPDREISFSVLSDSFGDILAAFIARKMGLPVKRIIIACREDDIPARALETGIYDARSAAANAAAADIQAPANFERLLFEAGGRDAALIREQMRALAEHGCFTLADKQREELDSLFLVSRATAEETAKTLSDTWSRSGYLADPHTAAALKAARDYQAGRLRAARTDSGAASSAGGEPLPREPVIIPAAAHPAKFPQAVERATKKLPVLPAWARELDATQEKYITLPADIEAIKAYIEKNSSAAREPAAAVNHEHGA